MTDSLDVLNTTAVAARDKTDTSTVDSFYHHHQEWLSRLEEIQRSVVSKRILALDASRGSNHLPHNFDRRRSERFQQCL